MHWQVAVAYLFLSSNNWTLCLAHVSTAAVTCLFERRQSSLYLRQAIVVCEEIAAATSLVLLASFTTRLLLLLVGALVHDLSQFTRCRDWRDQVACLLAGCHSISVQVIDHEVELVGAFHRPTVLTIL